MLKPVIVATAALAVVGSSIVYAQQRFGGPNGDGGPRFEQRRHFSADDMAAFADARIAALKAGLALTPDQAKNWPAFEQALRDLTQLRIQRRQAREAALAGNQQDQTATSPLERLGRRADAMSKTSAVLKHVADTGTPLYQSLNDAQKNRFQMLARLLQHHRMHARFEGNGRDGAPGGHWRWKHDGRRFGQNDDGGQMHRLMGSDGQGSDL